MAKGQAAIEYLMTYGWAFLAILLAVSALMYFNIVNPENFLPQKCGFGDQLECADFVLTASDQELNMTFQNNFNRGIVVTQAYAQKHAITGLTAGSISAGSTGEVAITFSDTFVQSERYGFTLILTFARDEPGAPEHNLTGSVQVTAQ